jgi:hypothetical protein
MALGREKFRGDHQFGTGNTALGVKFIFVSVSCGTGVQPCQVYSLSP